MTTTKPKCKCGKPMPIAPEYCKDCGQGYLGNKKLVVVGVAKCIQAEPDQSKKVDTSNKPNDWKEKFKKEFYEGDDYTSNKYINLVSFIEFEILPDLLSQQQKEIIEEILSKQVFVTYKEDNGHGIAVPVCEILKLQSLKEKV